MPGDTEHSLTRRLVLVPTVVALLAAPLGILVDYLAKPAEEFTQRESVYAALAGGLIGATIATLVELIKHLHGSLVRLEKVAVSADVRMSLLTRLPLSEILSDHDEHIGICCQLIKDAFKNINTIANVNNGRYLGYLQSAIASSKRYEGIQRFPMRWFREHQEAAIYLKKLRDKKMDQKVRIFVIEDGEAAAMTADLADPDLLAFYWHHTGVVDTYWITASELRRENLPILEDCALYDERLLIQYDPERRLLDFEVRVDRQAGAIEKASKLFSALRRQMEGELATPFHRIARDAHPPAVSHHKNKDTLQDEQDGGG
jgi:hypothetical protein